MVPASYMATGGTTLSGTVQLWPCTTCPCSRGSLPAVLPPLHPLPCRFWVHAAVRAVHAGQRAGGNRTAGVLRLGAVGQLVAVAGVPGGPGHAAAQVCALGARDRVGLAWPHLRVHPLRAVGASLPGFG